MYQNILIPVLLDEDHHNTVSFDVARKLANSDAKFTILHVIEPIPGYVISQIPEDVQRSNRKERETTMSRMAQDLLGSEAKIVSGHAGRTIVDYAKSHEIDCIIVASHRPGIGDFFLGSTAARVVRHANCSVHVIR
ncbi:universal stress protein [Sulfitobacter sp.]|uniref:universal stress protein n=1 Tax=Sulfitobacter sp. TaxID=1903071 RepID=UPI0030024107